MIEPNAFEAVQITANSSDPSRYIRDTGKTGFDSACFHYTIYRNLKRFLGYGFTNTMSSSVLTPWIVSMAISKHTRMRRWTSYVVFSHLSLFLDPRTDLLMLFDELDRWMLTTISSSQMTSSMQTPVFSILVICLGLKIRMCSDGHRSRMGP